MLKSELDQMLETALDSRGDWYLIPMRIRGVHLKWYDGKKQSYVFHACSKSLDSQDNKYTHKSFHPYMSVFTFVLYTPEGMSQSCGCCHEHVPEDLQTAWTLHNFDAIDS